jgi:hypothetical protein
MRHLPTILTVLAASAVPASAALPFVIDDFLGGPHTISLTSLAPPELALGTFGHGGAVGGVRDVVVISETIGSFAAGVQFGNGGYASFVGEGRGGIVYDGVPGITDVNADIDITAVDLDYGLNLDLDLGNCPPASVFLHVNAFADLPLADVEIIFATDAANYWQYTIPLTTVGAYDDYVIPFFAPTLAVGAFDPNDVGAIVLFHDGGNFPNLDIRVAEFELVSRPRIQHLLSLPGSRAWRPWLASSACLVRPESAC